MAALNLQQKRDAYVDRPAVSIEPVSWVEPYDQSFTPSRYCTDIEENGAFAENAFQVTKLQEKVAYHWQSKKELDSWIDHYHCLFRVIKVNYQITCGNKLKYNGTEYLLSSTWKLNEAYASDSERNAFKALAHDWVDLPLSSLLENGQVVQENGNAWNYQPELLNKNDLLEKWKIQLVDYPSYRFTGTPGTLPRPVLLIHGLNSDYKVWGVIPILDEKGSDLFQTAQVSRYENGTLPDLLARSQNLNNSPDAINHNGIYFYQAPGSRQSNGRWADALPHWSNTNSTESQSLALYHRISQVLTETYGDTWISEDWPKIDLVCHSQGGLVVREMLQGLRENASLFPVGSANPANHIEKIVTVNSPHFGTSLAGSAELVAADFPGLATVIEDLDAVEPNRHLLVEANVNMGFWEKTGLAVLEGADNTHDAGWWNALSPAVAVGTFAYGFVDGAVSDVRLQVHGPYLGPWTVTTTHEGRQVADPIHIAGPSGFVNSLRRGREGASHLSTFSEFIFELRGVNASGFPTTPDGRKIKTLPMFSEDMKPMISDLFRQVTQETSLLCSEGNRSQGCLAYAELLSEFSRYKAGHTLRNVNPNDRLWATLLDFQNGWMTASDGIVDATSQKFIDRNIGLMPENPILQGQFERPRSYAIHDAMAPWEAVAHGPFDFNENVDRVGTIAMDQQGASQQGFDLMCALLPHCNPVIESANPRGLLRLQANTVLNTVPSLDASYGQAYPVSAQSLDLLGNFNFKPLYVSSGIQGVSVALGHEIKIVAAYQPGFGSYIWWKDAQGLSHQELIFNEQMSSQPTVARIGDQIIVSFTNYSGLTIIRELDLDLPESLQLSVIGEQGMPLLGMATGDGIATDPLTQAPPQAPIEISTANSPISLVHVEKRGAEAQTSRPHIWIKNLSQNTIHGYKIAYYFTADPSRNPQVTVDYPQIPVVLEHLGGDQWRFVLDGSNHSILTNAIEPGTSGWQIRVHYGDWSEYKHLNDWSANSNIGQIKPNAKIVVYNAEGKIIWGTEPKPFQTQITHPLPTAQASLSWSDLAVHELNTIKPQVTIHNTGLLALKNYHALLYFRAPNGKVLHTPVDDWYTPESTPSLRHLGNGIWELDIHFDRHILYPGQSVTEANMGLHLSDWSTMDKTLLAMALVDDQDQVFFGNRIESHSLPPVVIEASTHLEVWARDEAISSSNQPQIRIRIKNQGQGSVSGLTMTLPIRVESFYMPVLESWYVPHCQSTLAQGYDRQWVVQFQCQNMNLQPGATWPNESGIVFGLHYQQWQVWNRQDDLGLNGLSAEWSRTSNILLTEVAQ